MPFHLIVKDDFYPYVKGTRIEDSDEVERVLDSESADKVVKIEAPAATTYSRSTDA